MSILSVYPQDRPAGEFWDGDGNVWCIHMRGTTGSLFEEWVVLANYEATTTGEISVRAGDRVKVIKKEDSG